MRAGLDTFINNILNTLQNRLPEVDASDINANNNVIVYLYSLYPNLFSGDLREREFEEMMEFITM